MDHPRATRGGSLAPLPDRGEATGQPRIRAGTPPMSKLPYEMPVYYPDSMGEPTPSALGIEPEGTRAFLQASERIVRLALRSVGGRYARVYRIDPDGSASACVASADPDDASPAHG